MKLIADNNGSLTSSELFPPGAVFEATRDRNGLVRVIELTKPEVPLVKPVRTKEGFLMSPVKVDRATVRAAIRLDRDSR